MAPNANKEKIFVLERQIRHFGYKIHQNLIKNDVLSSKSTFEIQNQVLKTLA